MLIIKWLDKLDESRDGFYLSIRDGLKYVLISTLANIELTTNSTQHIQQVNLSIYIK